MMNPEKIQEQAIRFTLAAAETAQIAPDARPWDYGWCVEDYRRSADAAISSPQGPIRLSLDGVRATEELHSLLAKRLQVRECWDLEELWGLLASIVSVVYLSAKKEERATELIGRILSTQPSLVVFPISNISWNSAPMKVGKKTVIGTLDSTFIEAIAALGGRARSHKGQVADYLDGLTNRHPRVGFATLVRGQRNKADSQAERRLQLLVDLTILLVPDKNDRNLWSLRGDTNRPGVRGIFLDRSAVEAGLSESGDQVELYATPLIIDGVGESRRHRWRHEDPIPLSDLLQEKLLRDAVERCLEQEGGILRRLHVASRWFADSYWASIPDDAALAAGVALDALLGSKSGLPGRAMRERYALLEADAAIRPRRAREYWEFYSVRSSIAHGGESSRLGDSGYLRSMQELVSWTAWRLLAAQARFAISSENELEALFEDLRWGIRHWPDGEDATIRGIREDLP